MKKLFSTILVLGLLLDGNAFANTVNFGLTHLTNYLEIF